MRINTEDSIKQAKEVHDRFGSWADARKAMRKEDDAPSETEKVRGAGG